jgi:hypothetical protein
MRVLTSDEVGVVSGGDRSHAHTLISFAAISVGKDDLPDQFKPKVEVVDMTGTYEEFIDPDNPPEIPPSK